MLTFQINDPSFAAILGEFPQLHTVATGFVFLEGPVYMSSGKDEGYLFVTDWSNNSITAIGYRAPSEITRPILYRQPAAFPAGQTATPEGQLLTCGSTDHVVTTTTPNGDTAVLVNQFEGTPLNSPNDIVVKSDGSVWFTDPAYTALEFVDFPPPQLPNNVYRFDPATGDLSVVAMPKEAELMSPNGLAFSNDEKLLYIADSGAEQADDTYYTYYPHRVRAYEVAPDGKSLVMPGRDFFVADVVSGYVDGLRVDVEGNAYLGTFIGVEVVNPAGTLIGIIKTPTTACNLAFGGPDNDILFITASDTVYGVKLKTKGAVPIYSLGFDPRLPEFFSNSKLQPALKL